MCQVDACHASTGRFQRTQDGFLVFAKGSTLTFIPCALGAAFVCGIDYAGRRGIAISIYAKINGAQRKCEKVAKCQPITHLAGAQYALPSGFAFDCEFSIES